jgi:hypothetical protein
LCYDFHKKARLVPGFFFENLPHQPSFRFKLPLLATEWIREAQPLCDKLQRGVKIIFPLFLKLWIIAVVLDPEAETAQMDT